MTALATPSEPFAAWPPGAFHTLSLSKVQSAAAALVRYLVKLSVVPESSERCTAWIAVDGSLAPGLSALIAGVVPLGDLAGEDLGQGGRLELEVVHAVEVVGDGDRADDHRQVDAPGRRRSGRWPCGCSSVLERGVGAGEVGRAGDEGCDAGAGAGGLVVDLAPVHFCWYALIHSSMAFFCADEP